MSDNQQCADPRIPPREKVVVRYLIDQLAKQQPEQDYVLFGQGQSINYRQLRSEVVSKAAGLQQLGVQQGEHVAVWLPNIRECLISFLAINYLGAVYVPFNTAYVGNILEHVVENSDAKLIIAHTALAPELANIELAQLQTLVLVGPDKVAIDGLASQRYDHVTAEESQLKPPAKAIEPWDIQSIIYTSGTTGPSKGVLSSYLHMYTNAGPETWHFVGADDRFLVNMPMFHIGGMGIAYNMLVRGASIAIMENFSTDTFWPFVRETQCSAIFMLGVMASFLLKQPSTEQDRDHAVRLAFMVPLTEEAQQFRQRFGIDIYTIFNMTEISSPIVSAPNPLKTGTCGKARPGVDVRLVDSNDCEVANGETGEMILRTDRPFGMNSGYYKNPEATSSAWRNGWFHTGDCFRKDADGFYYFVDRVKDAIRRRGENISSFEVEAEVIAHPAVQEVAAIGVASEHSEDEVMIVVAAVAGQQIDPEALLAFLLERMPRFMVPRYIRVLEALPKTPTAKVQKVLLRQQGVCSNTWDREAAGIKVKRKII
ncbi:MAG: AMP-binding protein [Cellvibrionaceae bacterium]|nr:AMP-binding protein [Cellvibrionaceae bacterium]